MKELIGSSNMLLVWLGAIPLLLGLWKLLSDFWLMPRALEAALSSQGIRSPPRGLLVGNLKEMMRLRKEMENRDLPTGCHEIQEHVFPHLVRWSKVYGIPFAMWWGSEPRVIITDLEMIKEVLYNRSNKFWRSLMQQKFLGAVLGKGLVLVNGEEWAMSRRIVSPAFHAEKIKGMVGTMVCCADEMLARWDALAAKSESGTIEVEVCKEFAMLTANVLSRTAFGTSFQDGHRALDILQLLFPIALKSQMSPWNLSLKKRIRDLNKEMEKLLGGVIQARRDLKNSGKQENYGDDLLGLMLEEVDLHIENSGPKRANFTDENLVNECKTFYVAGHETTSTLLTWVAMLLALSPLWQERAREEVLQVCKQDKPNAESASRLKIVGMVLNEALRLYPPASLIIRQAFEDAKLGDLFIPAGVSVHVPVLDILHDPELWGDDANEFNPERFSKGVTSACKHPIAFMPFSHGPRACIGQGFALTEAKVALAMLLQRFDMELSPRYRHCPVLGMSLKPRDGMPILLHRRKSTVRTVVVTRQGTSTTC